MKLLSIPACPLYWPARVKPPSVVSGTNCVSPGAAAGAMRLLLEGHPPLLQLVAGAVVASGAYALALGATGVVSSDPPRPGLLRRQERGERA